MTKKILGGKYEFDGATDFIGSGSYGKVYRCKSIDKNNNGEQGEYCVKVIEKNIGSEKQKKQLEQEIDIMKKISKGDCQNLVQVLDFFEEPTVYNIILELCDYDLEKEFKELKTQQKWYDQSDAIEIIQQIVAGFKFLFDMKVVHRDIKPSNILVKTINRGDFNEQKLYKIADFGFSKVLNSLSEKGNLTRVGTPAYVAPQLYFDNQFSGKCDIYSYGIVFYQLCYDGKYPYEVKYPQALKDNLKNLQKNPLKCQNLKGQYGKQLQELLERMIVYSEEQRISFDEIFQHPLLQIQVRSTKDSIFQQFEVKFNKQQFELEQQQINEEKKISRLQKISKIIAIFYRKFLVFKHYAEQLQQNNSNDIQYEKTIYCLIQLGQIQLSYAMGMINAIVTDIHKCFKEENDLPHLINILVGCKNSAKQYPQFYKEREDISYQYLSWKQTINDFNNKLFKKLHDLMSQSYSKAYEDFWQTIKQGTQQKQDEPFFTKIIPKVDCPNEIQQIVQQIQKMENDFPIRNYQLIDPKDIYKIEEEQLEQYEY